MHFATYDTLIDDLAKTIASSLVGSWLNYANCVLVSTSSKNVSRLQHIQNTLAKIIMKVPRDHMRSVNTMHLLSILHWLSVRRRIDYKIAVVIYKLLSTGQLSCLACRITPYVPGRCLRSTESRTLTAPRIRTAIGACALSSVAPSMWNNIPIDVRNAPSLEPFCGKLKSLAFY